MRQKVAALAGAFIGWGGAGTLIFTGDTRQAVLAQAFLLTLGATSSGWLMLACRNRPLSHAFELGRDAGWCEGYQAGRADVLAEAGGGRVVRLRAVGQVRGRVSV